MAKPVFPTIKDREVAFPSRVKLTKSTSDPGANVYDVTPHPGTIMEQGTPIDAALFTALHSYIDAADKNMGENFDEKLKLKADVTYVNATFAKKAYVQNSTLHIF